MKRCAECEEARNKWLDHRPTFGQYMPYASSDERRWKGAVEGYSMRANDYRALVRREQCAHRRDLLEQASGGVGMSYDSEEWRDGANCASTDPDIFFPPVGQPAIEAKKICAACDVRAQCLEYAMSHGERVGIWGGMSARRFHDLGKAS